MIFFGDWETAWHPSLHRLITKGWDLLFYIWRKHCLHNTDRFTAPCSNPELKQTAIRPNIDGQLAPPNFGRQGYSLLYKKSHWDPTVSNKNSTQKLTGWWVILLKSWWSQRGLFTEYFTPDFAIHNPSKIDCFEVGMLVGISLTHH